MREHPEGPEELHDYGVCIYTYAMCFAASSLRGEIALKAFSLKDTYYLLAFSLIDFSLVPFSRSAVVIISGQMQGTQACFWSEHGLQNGDPALQKTGQQKLSPGIYYVAFGGVPGQR